MSHLTLSIAFLQIIVGNLTAALACYRISRIAARSKLRSGNFALVRARRVARARRCESCQRRGRQGHPWFCAKGDSPLSRYYDDMKPPNGWRQ